MGKKRRAIAHPNKFKARARIMDRLRKIPTAPISNSEAVEELQQKTAPVPEPAPAPEPVVEPEPVAAASAEVEEPAPAKRPRPAKKKATRTRKAATKKTDSSEAQ